MPKFGPLKVLKFKNPGPDAEKKFIASFDTVTVHYTGNLAALHKHIVQLGNVDFDTGIQTAEGEYALADQTYCKLLLKLKEKKFETVTPSLKENIISFYATQIKYDPPKRKLNVTGALAQLKNSQ